MDAEQDAHAQREAADKFRYVMWGAFDERDKVPPKGEFFCRSREKWMPEIPGEYHQLRDGLWGWVACGLIRAQGCFTSKKFRSEVLRRHLMMKLGGSFCLCFGIRAEGQCPDLGPSCSTTATPPGWMRPRRTHKQSQTRFPAEMAADTISSVCFLVKWLLRATRQYG